MAPRIRCEDCGRGHNGREGARRCRARATRDADERRLRARERGPDGPPASGVPPKAPGVRARRLLDDDTPAGYLESDADYFGNNNDA